MKISMWQVAKNKSKEGERIISTVSNESWKVRVGQIGIFLILLLMSLPIIIMYLWLFVNSFSKQMVLGLIPKSFTLEHWRFLWSKVSFGLTIYPNIWPITLNTLFFALGITAIVVVVSTLSGFALSRFSFRTRDSIIRMTMLLHAFPGVTLLIGIFYCLHLLRLLDTLVGVMLVRAALEIPFATWILKGFFDEISWDIEWSAYIDGCSKFQAWYKIILPLIKPGIAAISIFAFLSGWSEFIYLFTYIFSGENYTLSLFVRKITVDFRFVDYGFLTAVSCFYMIPPLIFFIFTQKSLMKVAIGGVKGH